MNWKYGKIAICIVNVFTILFCCFSCTSVDKQKNDGCSYLSVDLPQLEKTNQRLYYSAYGRLTGLSYADSVFVLSEAQDNDQLNVDIYLVADIADGILTYNLGKWEKAVLQNGTMFLTDLDDDGIEEIVLTMEITGNGGTLSRIFKIRGQEIVLVEDLDSFDPEISCEFGREYVFRIWNDEIGFEQTFDVRQEYPPEVFDAFGQATVKPEISFLEIEHCKSDDKNEDGIPELYYTRGIKLENTLGTMTIGIQYDKNRQAFDLVYASVQ